jgi:hypothetical protein
MILNHKKRFVTKYYRLLLIQLLVVCIPFSVYSQRNEVGVFFGGSYYLGDLNPSRQFAMSEIAIGGLYRLNLDRHISLRLNGFVGSVSGDDARVKYNENRNLSFRSIILEASLQGEVNFLPFVPGEMETPATPYLFGGGGVFRFNPKTQLDGRWVELKPHGTEGQGSMRFPDRDFYSLTSYNLLFGIGYKFNITRELTGAFEWGMRRTGTDYLDDVSTTYPHPDVFENNQIALALYDRSIDNRGENTNFQRGNPNTNDWYSFAGVIITYRIKNVQKRKCPAYN